MSMRHVQLVDHIFKSIHTITKDGKTYEVLSSQFPHRTMVAFSAQTHVPIAALVLGTEDTTALTLVSGRPPPASDATPHFMGITARGGSAVNFVIANFGQTQLQFNLLHTPHDVAEKNPGATYGLNQINELEGRQASCIDVDQRTGKTMLITGVTQPTDGAAVSVKVSEEKKEAPKGQYIRLQLAPSLNTPEAKLFQEGEVVWRCVNEVVSQKPWIQISRIPRVINSFPQRSFLDNNSFSFGNFGSSTYNAPVAYASSVSGSSFGNSSSDNWRGRGSSIGGSRGGGPALEVNHNPIRGFSFGAPPPYADPEVREIMQRNLTQVMARSEQLDELSNNSQTLHPGPTFGSSSFSFGAVATPVVDQSYTRELLPPVPMDADADEVVEVATDKRRKTHVPPVSAPIDIMSTQIAKLAEGEVRDVHSRETDAEYDYDLSVCSAVLCLSIHPTLTLSSLPPQKETIEDVLAQFFACQDAATRLAIPRIFKSKHCVIDSGGDDDSTDPEILCADTILCQCGHQCVHHSNADRITKCPLCRAPIATRLRATDIAE